MDAQRRYAKVAITLHWLIALGILGMIPAGFTLAKASHALADGHPFMSRELIFIGFQAHKSVGITILILSLARLAWRLMNPPPPLPEAMSAWERLASRVVHWAFYVLIIALPLSGWAMVSASRTGLPTILYNFIHWPHIGPLANLPADAKRDAHELFEETHMVLAWTAVALVNLHILAALKHQFLDKDNLLARMIPGVFGKTTPPSATRGAAIAFGLAGAVLVIGAVVGVLSQTRAPAQAAETTTPGAAHAWTVDHDNSAVAFTLFQEGKPVAGGFDSWTADITFDPEAPENARVEVRVDTRSVKIADAYLTGQAVTADGFDSADTPYAVFTSSDIRPLGGDLWQATGDLVIRDATSTVILPFELDITDGRARMRGEITLDRLDFSLGADNDPDAQWIDREVKVAVEVEATRAR